MLGLSWVRCSQYQNQVQYINQCKTSFCCSLTWFIAWMISFWYNIVMKCTDQYLSGPIFHISVEWLCVQYCFNSIFRYTARPKHLGQPSASARCTQQYWGICLADDNGETSDHVADGVILQNVLKELEPEQDNGDDPNDDPAEQDPDYISSMGQLLHMVNHQKAFLQQNKFPVEVLWQLEALEQAIIHQQVKTCNKQQSLMAFFK